MPYTMEIRVKSLNKDYVSEGKRITAVYVTHDRIEALSLSD